MSCSNFAQFDEIGTLDRKLKAVYHETPEREKPDTDVEYRSILQRFSGMKIHYQLRFWDIPGKENIMENQKNVETKIWEINDLKIFPGFLLHGGLLREDWNPNSSTEEWINHKWKDLLWIEKGLQKIFCKELKLLNNIYINGYTESECVRNRHLYDIHEESNHEVCRRERVRFLVGYSPEVLQDYWKRNARDITSSYSLFEAACHDDKLAYCLEYAFFQSEEYKSGRWETDIQKYHKTEEN